MKIYIAGSVQGPKNVVEAAAELEEAGHSVLRWWEIPTQRPFSKHPDNSKNISAKLLSLIPTASVFVLIARPEAHAAMVDFGIWLGAKPSGLTFVVGAEREVVFYHRPNVVNVQSIHEVVDCLNG